MKLLHISDLHIGKRVNAFSMIEDQKYILRQILAIADSQQADGVMIAGDIYDKPVPFSFILTLALLASLPACGQPKAAGPLQVLVDIEFAGGFSNVDASPL